MICDLHTIVDLDQLTSLMGQMSTRPGGVNICDACMGKVKKRLAGRASRTDFNVRICRLPWEHVAVIV